MNNFHALAVVGRGSETQLQVGENLNYIIWRFKAMTSYFQSFTIYNSGRSFSKGSTKESILCIEAFKIRDIE